MILNIEVPPQKNLLCIFFISLLFLPNGKIRAESCNKSYSVLFIGNSYTYFNSMPEMFKSMVENEFPDYLVKVGFIGGGGATLKDHWEIGEALQEIKYGRWNYVVLQGQSMLGSDNLADPDSPKEFYKYSRKLDAEIKKSGAKTVFFMTWARKNLPQQQKYITKAYETIGKKLEDIVAPVGEAWEKFRELSAAELYMPGGSHPTITGSYLCALTLFGSIFHTMPKNPPAKLYGYTILRGGKLSNQKSCLCDLSKGRLKLLRQAVMKIMFEKIKK